jgi:hypothetical protein
MVYIVTTELLKGYLTGGFSQRILKILPQLL